MSYTVERFASGPQGSVPFGDYTLARESARAMARDTGEDFAIFDSNHELQEVIQPSPQPRWHGFDVVDRVEFEIGYAISALQGAKTSGSYNRTLWRDASAEEAVVIDLAIEQLSQARRILGAIDSE